MDSEHKLVALLMILGTVIIVAFTWGAHKSSIRTDAIQLECVKQGRVWANGTCLGDSKK